ncbi:hypothetical protein [Lysobacter fragariae]
MTLTFREGEARAMGRVEKVTFRRKGKDVFVTYETGMAKGHTFRYTIIDADTVSNESGRLRRISR